MFKVGDWVRYKDTLDIFQIKKDTQAFMIENNEDIYKVCELWQPQISEECWFYNDDSEVPHFDRLHKVHLECDSKYETVFVDELWQYCEPFIGTLPTFIKDKR